MSYRLFIFCYVVINHIYLYAYSEILNSPKLLHPTNSSLVVKFEEFTTSSTFGAILGYQIDYKSLYDDDWKSLSSSSSSGGDGDNDGRSLTVSQVISIRVDVDKKIKTGSFQLALNRLHLVQSDIDASSRTPLIPFDASSAQVKMALGYLSNVVVKEVKRCDDFGLSIDSNIGHGGNDFWNYGCPYKSHGGYRWLIIFDVKVLDPIFLPNLIVTKSYFGHTWTNPGDQIVVSSTQSGAIHPTLCQYQVCTYTIDELLEGTPYACRYRILTNFFGWLPYSKVSDYIFTLESKVPSRPQAPLDFFSSTDTSISLKLSSPPSIQSVFQMDIQYQLYNYDNGNNNGTNPSASSSTITKTTTTAWSYIISLPMSLDFKGTLVADISGLQPCHTYLFRVRYINTIGPSIWSQSSQPISTKPNISVLSLPLPPIIISLSSSIVVIGIQTTEYFNEMLDTIHYRIQYKPNDRSDYQFVPDILSIPGTSVSVVTQEISTRADIAQVCVGSYILSYKRTISSKLDDTLSYAIPFAVSATEMKFALQSIKELNTSTSNIIVNRRSNSYHGYTYTIQLIGSNDFITPILIHSHTLQLSISSPISPPYYNDSKTIIQPCFRIADPIITSILPTNQSKNKKLIDSIIGTIEITGLYPKYGYKVRTIVIDSQEKEYISESISFTTLDNIGNPYQSNNDNNISDLTINANQLNLSSGFTIENIYITYINDTAISIAWNINWQESLWGMAYQFNIEQSNGQYALDFINIGSIPASGSGMNYNMSFLEIGSYTATNLLPETYYRYRVIPIFRRGRGNVSTIVMAKTLAHAMNYWEPIFTRPASVQEYQTSDPRLPSPRRGHSLSLVKNVVYMFGGRTDGISCAEVYKDVEYLGSPESGRVVYPCVSNAFEVQELWSLDLLSYEWLLIDNINSINKPYPREQHNAIVGSDNNLYIFGGKRSSSKTDPYGNPILTPQMDIVYGDLYMFEFHNSETLKLVWPSTITNIDNNTIDSMNHQIQFKEVDIPQDRRLFLTVNMTQNENRNGIDYGDGIHAKEGLCIDSIVVKILFEHDCLKQLKFSLIGPGPTTVSQSYDPLSSSSSSSSGYEVSLLNLRSMNKFDGCTKGRFNFLFNDLATRETDSCCLFDEYESSTFSSSSIAFKPEGKISSYIGASPISEWTLVVEDMVEDTLIGKVLSWEIDFTLSSCSLEATGIWYNLTQYDNTQDNNPYSSSIPTARYDAISLSYDRFLFIYGGRDLYDRQLDDLYRYDIIDRVWSKLTPIDFNIIALYTSSSVGSNFMLTSYGLLRYGGYYRQPYMTTNTDIFSYVSDIFRMNPLTLRWQKVLTFPWPQLDGSIGEIVPNGRYHSAMVFIPSSRVNFQQSISYRSLYDELIPSVHLNYEGAISDSILMFGGSNGATGSVFDGSSGGLLSDTWMVRLANWSTDGNRYQQQSYVDIHCQYRNQQNQSVPNSCLQRKGNYNSSNSATFNPSCSLRELLLLNWCSGNNQTVA